MGIIGEKGINLSGGQKARISLARAVYQPLDMFLLDDPLSAVDTIVGEHLFDRCIVNLLKGHTRILVTHQTQYLPRCDRIVVLDDDGTVRHCGTYEDLVANGDIISQVTADVGGDAPEPTAAPTDPNDAQADPKPSETGDQAGKQQGKGVIQKEAGSVGAVTRHVYQYYWRAASSRPGLCLLLVLLVGAEIVYIFTPWFASVWAAQSLQEQQEGMQYWLGTPGWLVLAVVILAMARSLLFFQFCVEASRTMFLRMLQKVLRAPIGWFDANPSGRILNRFSSDTGIVDDQLAPAFYDFVALGISVTAYVMLTAVIVPISVVSVIPIGLVFRILQKKYLSSSREVKRIEAASRSPLFPQISETLNGLVTVRAFKKEVAFKDQFFAKQRLNVRGYFAFIAVARWFAVRLDLICSAFTTFFLVVSLIYHGVHRQLGLQPVDPGLMGLTLTCVIRLCDMFQWAVRQSAEVENFMVSTERIQQYCHLPSEAPAYVEGVDDKIDPEWPHKGEIALTGLSITYRADLAPTLQNITCTIPAGASVAVVGRTAAGKSTLVQALLRLIEPNGPQHGQIRVDGLDIATLGLTKVRDSVALIGQTPWLFSSTLRANLSPFGRYNDDQMWEALDMVSMSSTFKDADGLDTVVSESGSNLSVGQKQLNCLARCLLGRKRIFIFDEPTANIDNETDAFIQNAIRTMDALKTATTITVAHRLATVIDYDYVMVMENGKLIQFGSPHELLESDAPRNKFLSMVDATGEETAQLLKMRAKEANEERANGSK